MSFRGFILETNVEHLLSKKIILDRHSNVISHSRNQRSEVFENIKLEMIDSDFLSLLLSSEDSNFYSHSGVDFSAILRSFIGIFHSRYKFSGASTITMQLARILKPKLKHPFFKFSQMLFAWRLEALMSKDEILSLYLTHLPFAHQIAGVQKASHFFFDKAISQLSLKEKAILAVLPRNPSLYKQKRRIHKLANKLISKTYSSTIHTSLALVESVNFALNRPKASHYHLVTELLKNHDNSKEIKTTIDLNIQNWAQDKMNESIHSSPQKGDSGAMLIIHNKSREILAYIANGDIQKTKAGFLNFVKIKRSPGSAIKPFLYLQALKQGYSLSSLLPDVPYHRISKNSHLTPKNYDGSYSGPIQLRYSLANSKNIPALYLTEQLGIHQIFYYLRRLEIVDSILGYEHFGVGISLGNAQVSLESLARAYVGLANKGEFSSLKLLVDDDSVTYYQEEQVSTYLITKAISDAHSRSQDFGSQTVFDFPFPVAVKTGTSSDYKDNWTIGYSSQYTVAVWKGNADATGMTAQSSAVNNTGDIFAKTMKYLHKHEQSHAFKEPSGLVETRVCSLSGGKSHELCEHTRLELIKDSTMLKSCLFHVKSQCSEKTVLNLPNEYLSWARLNKLTLLRDEKCGTVQPSDEGVQINYPRDKMVFAIDPRLPLEDQKIAIEITDTPILKNYRLLLDEKEIELKSSKLSFAATKGDYTLKLLNLENKLLHRVEYSVR